MRPPRPPRTTEGTFQAAVRAHLAGQHAAAIQGYELTLADQSWHAPAHNNLGTLRAAHGDTAAAERHFEAAIQAQPDYGEAWNNLGILRAGAHRNDEAVVAFTRAVELEPAKAAWWNNLGNALIECFRFREAVTAYDRAATIDPRNADHWANLAIAWRGLYESDKAIAAAEHALTIDPRHVPALNNLGALFKEARRFDEAIATFERAIAGSPTDATLVANLAAVHERRGDYEEMRRVAARARDLDPANPEPWNLLANYEMEAGRLAEAERLYQHVVAMDPHNRNANWNLALVWLMQGDYARGWPQFEWRKRLQSVVTDHGSYEAPEWRGEPLQGRTLLLHTEQGIGDAIQFVRYAPVLRAAGAGRIVVEAPWPIVPLLRTAHGVDDVVARGAPLPPVDVHASMMSLPALCGTTIDAVPAEVPYFRTEPRAVTSLVTAPPGDLKVGIVWAGNPQHARDHLRSTALADMLAAVCRPGVTCFSLQKGEAAEAELRAAAATGVVDLAPHLNDFRDTASVIEHLDLVITVDTSVAHLAGALGVPTWVLITRVPDFRWMLDREDTPWYPTMRLLRQSRAGDWRDVFARISATLGEVRPRAAVTPIDDVVTIHAQTRTPDGRSRFDVWAPLADLAEPDLFAEYEAELVGDGAHAATRTFLREFLTVDSIYIDALPGLGLVAIDVATQTTPPAEIILVGDPHRGERIVGIAALRAPAVTCRVAPSLASVLSTTRGRRAVWRVGRDEAKSVAALLGTDPGFAGVVVWADGGDAARRTLDASWRHFALDAHGGESSLEAIDASTPASCAVSMPRSVLEAVQAARRPAVRVVGVDWEAGSGTGWGVYGENLLHHLSQISGVVAAALVPPAGPAGELMRRSAVLQGEAARMAVGDGIVLHALGNELLGATAPAPTCRRRVGVVFFEDTAFDSHTLARGEAFDLLVAGSTWNAEVLRDRGLRSVAMVMQGIDPVRFHPAPRSGLFPGRFVIFSGGKLEYRKGQDIVVAAFREFAKGHPDALLVVGWHNAWADLICDLELAGHVTGRPVAVDGVLDVTPWLCANGVPATQVVDLGRQSNALMAQLIREADVAVFPNRAEGGTNLVAMECMAAGVATLVSANTGHLDLVATGGCVALREQGAVAAPTRYFRGTDGWGETSVDETIATLEKAYTDTAWRRALAERGATAMATLTWQHQVGQLLDVLDPLW